ncbi:hypothetical protein GCM10017083_17340 [Thalassobaculum fulvum]|jgi:hypothetical protein|uniref:Uncharacterized protein n=1 Tax=Thalassobaculum fulvum TaxID=1633335 RepID=A0A918XRL5_9PROT|nr:hypothetical protein [Thalassobaculum fulvum]GHD47226.1 hypothetical protein GCM10017083_17340 [Thalassobaculum fulvum]
MDAFDTVEPILITMLLMIGIPGLFFVVYSKNVALKRRVGRTAWPIYGVAFAALLFTTGAPLHFKVVAGALFLVLMIFPGRFFKFCDSCGDTIIGINPISPEVKCPVCGGPLSDP